jgi:thiol-disulfide isomerase/thioredoxin
MTFFVPSSLITYIKTFFETTPQTFCLSHVRMMNEIESLRKQLRLVTDRIEARLDNLETKMRKTEPGGTEDGSLDNLMNKCERLMEDTQRKGICPQSEPTLRKIIGEMEDSLDNEDAFFDELGEEENGNDEPANSRGDPFPESIRDVREVHRAHKETGEPQLVWFFAPWCGHCKNMTGAWNEFHSRKGSFGAHGCDCSGVGKNVAAQVQISSFPTIKAFDGDEFVEYKGPRDANSMLAFLKDMRRTM